MTISEQSFTLKDAIQISKEISSKAGLLDLELALAKDSAALVNCEVESVNSLTFIIDPETVEDIKKAFGITFIQGLAEYKSGVNIVVNFADCTFLLNTTVHGTIVTVA